MSSRPGKAKSRPEWRHRRHPRYRVEFPLIVTLLSEAGHRSIDAHCRDLSVAGIGMLIAAELNMGEVVALKFTLPGSARAWDLHAVLRHRRGYHYGFEFLSLNHEEGNLLSSYLPNLERDDQDLGAARRE